MSTVLWLNGQGKAPTVHQPILPADDQQDALIAVIQALIPLGLQAVEEVLQQEVAALAGPRYVRGDGAPHLVRWGRQRGSVYLADQKLPGQATAVGRRISCDAHAEVPAGDRRGERPAARSRTQAPAASGTIYTTSTSFSFVMPCCNARRRCGSARWPRSRRGVVAL